ncbi:lambda-crystallin homolog isoform X2 [Cimex lectularius]|uniref:L-gulonate 3-dehydrogenase n=1 Tax=Cimex lectularius TaxID=79782 RepID=A0A8I6S1Z9_CIMLE|nr:lambda-crystallin homolog isoform X2 [Cimex lectularius]XP_014251953.1 lambda-crystallin homolog isoform X2 [Cimex lectularius]
MSGNKGKIAIIGSGLIGRSWSMLFVSVGYNVCIYDVVSEQVEEAKKFIKNELENMEKNKILKGKLSAEEQYNLISGNLSLSECLQGAIYMQECIPENLELKIKLYEEIDKVVGDKTIIASSTSTFVPSLFSENLKNRKNIVVAHPVNPPYFVPLVEIVPAPWTEPSVTKKTKEIMTEIGQAPVTLNREIPGFALNRIQYVILNECWNLIKEGILNVEDVDKVMSEGLGMRYAFLGPLETAHLNAEGMENYCARYCNSMYKVCQTMLPVPKFEGEQVKQMAKELCEKVPLDKLKERREWRDNCLTQLSSLKNKLPK